MLIDKTFWMMEPDTGANAHAAAPATPAPEAPAASAPAPSITQQAAAARTAPDGGGAAAPAASTPATPSAPSWIESLRKDGIDLGQDEKSAFENLKRLKQERDQLDGFKSYVPHIHDYLQNAKDFQAWRAEQAKQRQAAAPADSKKNVWDEYWQPPEYDPSWERRFLVRNPDGSVAWDKNTPPEVIAKAQAYATWRQDQADKFLQNPHAFIEPTVRALAQQIANQVVEQRFGQQRTTTDAHSFVQQHSGWLYETENGMAKQAPVFDPNSGQMRMAPVLSPLGKRFQEYVGQIHAEQQRHGYTDDNQAAALALAQVQRDFAVAELERLKGQQATPGGSQAAPAATPQQQSNQNFLDKNNPAGKNQQRQAVGRGSANVTPAEPKVTARNIEKIMKQSLIDGGFAGGIPK